MSQDNQTHLKAQSAIFNEGNAHHLFLEFTLTSVTGPLPGLNLIEKPTPRVYTTIGFGERVLDAVDHRLVPESLKPFKQIDSSAGFSAPATQADLFVWIQSNHRDEVFIDGMRWVQQLQKHTEQLREEHGFLFRDSRDLTGFVDGSANPKNEKRFQAALIPEGKHQGGSFVLAQRWEHNLPKFHSQSVEEQHQVIGRSKKESIELEGEEQPSNSHVSRTDIKWENEPVKIYRRSTPTGTTIHPGLFFLAFSADIERFEILLNSMFGLTEDKIQDRLLDFSKPLTGSFYYAPPLSILKRLLS